MPTAAIATWSGKKIEPYFRPDEAVILPVKLNASGNFPRGTILGELTGTNEIQTLAITGAPTGGTFTLTFGGQTTAAIAFNATAADVQNALEALSTIGDGNILCTGGPLNGAVKVRIEFRGQLGASNVAQLTSTDSLTGGTSPATSIATVTGGAAGTPGTYKAFDNDNTDGSEKPKCILMYDCQTDASGNITLSATAAQDGGLLGEEYLSVPAYFSGIFKVSDLVGYNKSCEDGGAFRNLTGVLAADAVVRLN